jgi:transcription initiation factor TFIIIB Brf1 subunit/transcription initiation factor TFIIB
MPKPKCPECQSECVRYRVRSDDFICVRCGQVFKAVKNKNNKTI